MLTRGGNTVQLSEFVYTLNLTKHNAPISMALLSPDETYVLSCSSDCVLIVSALKDGQVVLSVMFVAPVIAVEWNTITSIQVITKDGEEWEIDLKTKLTNNKVLKNKLKN